MSTENKKAPLDGAKAFMEGFELRDNPFYEFTEYFHEWIDEYREAKSNYEQEGRFRDGSFKG